MYNIENNSKIVIDLPLQNNNPSEWPLRAFPHLKICHMNSHELVSFVQA
jgi:hypothetical protein